MHQPRVVLATLFGLALTALGCSDNSQPTVPSEPSDDPSLRATPQQAASDNPNDLARGVRGFGGFFLDAQGAPTVYLKDEKEKGNAANALGQYFRAAGINPSQLKVRKGQFDWTDLERWQTDGGAAALALAGAVFADADEANNRLRIGVERGAAQAAIRKALAGRGVPDEAVIIEETDPIELMVSLQQANTRTGGLQINFPGFVCTLGFNDGTGAFITNSHCTTTRSVVEGTDYGQPLLSQGIVADEVTDPGFTTGGACPAGRVCRRSDAARARYRTGFSGQRGVISRTAEPNRKRNNLEITGTFTISGELASGGVVNATVNKIGRTTGWTQGRITQTNVTTSVSGSNITLFGQTFVSAGVGGGDSGSPVFALGQGSNVTLLGILWGGSSSGRSFVFSPIGNVEAELGAIASN
jgi:hypothetical protein